VDGIVKGSFGIIGYLGGKGLKDLIGFTK